MTKQTAIRKIAEGLFEYADAMYEEEQAAAPAPRAPAPIPEPFEEVAAELFPDEGSLSICPAHKLAYKPSKFEGKPGYCSAKADDPAWSRNGFCSITPNSAAIWLQQHAA